MPVRNGSIVALPPSVRAIDDVIAEPLLPVPRAVPRDERDVAVGLREHGAGIELDAEPGRVRAGQRRRQHDAGAGIRASGRPDRRCRWRGNRGSRRLAPSCPASNAVELVLRSVIAGPVAAVVGEPQFLGHRMPVEADRVAHAARDDLHAGAVRIVAADLAVDAGIDLADVAVGADLHVHLPVRAERDVFPVVMDGVGQVVGLGQFDRLARIVELVLDVVVAQHALIANT